MAFDSLVNDFKYQVLIYSCDL